MGIRSAVRFAAIIPASRATSSGSPLGFLGKTLRTLGFKTTKALASASRFVGDFAETSTIRDRPE